MCVIMKHQLCESLDDTLPHNTVFHLTPWVSTWKAPTAVQTVPIKSFKKKIGPMEDRA